MDKYYSYDVMFYIGTINNMRLIFVGIAFL